MKQLMNIAFIVLCIAAGVCVSVAVVTSAQGEWYLTGFSLGVLVALSYIGYTIYRVRHRMVSAEKEQRRQKNLEAARQRRMYEKTVHVE